MTSTPPYREQYDRMRRWYERFAAIDQGRAHDVASDNYVDEIYAFFLNCWHLKDWIKQDITVDAVKRERIEPFINSNRSLRLCADICNALKHLTLTSSRSGENPAFGKKQFALTLGSGLPTTISLKYEVSTDTGPMDAFVIATACMKAWDDFMTTL